MGEPVGLVLILFGELGVVVDMAPSRALPARLRLECSVQSC